MYFFQRCQLRQVPTFASKSFEEKMYQNLFVSLGSHSVSIFSMYFFFKKMPLQPHWCFSVTVNIILTLSLSVNGIQKGWCCVINKRYNCIIQNVCIKTCMFSCINSITSFCERGLVIFGLCFRCYLRGFFYWLLKIKA